MRLLILGGHGFVGRHIVETALGRGFHVTTFSRGRSPNRFGAQVEALHGDRRASLAALTGRTWDAVVDTCGYYPSAVEASSRSLRHQVEAYAFVSSLSAYPDHSRSGVDESDPAAWPVGQDDGEEAWSYGRRKAECERVVREAFPRSHLITRLGLAVGPHDMTGRFNYWLCRFRRGGEVLVPAPPMEPVQLIDARDHAAFLLDQLERREYGTYNATSPPGLLSMKDVLEATARATAASPAVSWVDPHFLLSYHARPWTDLPLWRGTSAETQGTMLFSTTKAQVAGLRVRPLYSTAMDIVAAGVPPEDPGRLSHVLERLILCAADEEGAIVQRDRR